MSINYKLISRYLKAGNNYIVSLAMTNLSVMTGKHISKPRQVYYLMSEKCNLECEMCPQWERGNKENKEDWISVERMKEILAELAAWKVSKFGVSGGEALIFHKRLFEMLETANSLGMYSHFVTNGWLLEKDVFLRYERIGGGHISLSIDGTEKTHDELRRKIGLHSRCINSLETFRSLGLKTVQMKINTVLSSKSLPDIGEMIKLSKAYKVPIYFQPFDPYAYGKFQKLTQDDLSEKFPLWIPSSGNDQLDEVVQLIRTFKHKFPHLVMNSKEHLNLIGPYFRNAIKPGMKRQCLAAYDTISIFPNGDVGVCWIGKIGNLKEKSAREVYYSEEFNKAREKSLNCQYPCMLGCLNRPGLLELIKIGLKNITNDQ